MSKKLPLSIALAFLGLGAFAQTIVGTAPENRNVVLEEFTGINCVFCPQGHAIAEQLKDDNPDDFYIVNVHSGGFADPNAGQPDFRTPEGEALDDQSGLAGYPAGTINRENFPGQEQGGAGSTALGRGEWASASAQVQAEASYVNVAVEAVVDLQTRELTVHVETYYTADSPAASNFLTVELMQNNTFGPQTGGNAGDMYVHQHRLVDMLTATFGEEITTTTTGTFVDRTYTYQVPADYNDIAVDVSQLEVVALIAETQQFIVSGSGAPVVVENFYANELNLISVEEVIPPCVSEITPTISVQNLTGSTVSNFDVTYSINGGAATTFTFTDDLESLEIADIQLATISYTEQATNTLDISLPADDITTNNDLSNDFGAVIEGAGNVTVSIDADQFANETSWDIKDSSGTVVASGSLSSADNNDTVDFEVLLGDEDCYSFTLNDSFGDGIFNGGGATLTDINGLEVLSIAGDSFTSTISRNLKSNGVLGLEKNNLSEVAVFPNPANTVLNISNADNATVEVYNILGQVMMTRSNISVNEQLNVANLAIGTYLVKIDNGVSISTKKFVIAR